MNWHIMCCIFHFERCTPTATLVRGDLAPMLVVSQHGLATPAHVAFVTRLRIVAGTL
jgi:hypothetical protein